MSNALKQLSMYTESQEKPHEESTEKEQWAKSGLEPSALWATDRAAQRIPATLKTSSISRSKRSFHRQVEEVEKRALAQLLTSSTHGHHQLRLPAYVILCSHFYQLLMKSQSKRSQCSFPIKNLRFHHLWKKPLPLPKPRCQSRDRNTIFGETKVISLGI